MKRKHRVFTSALAFSLLAGIPAAQTVLPVFAADQTTEGCTITISGAESDVTYKAYQIFTGVPTKENNNMILSDIAWGDGVNSDKVLEALNKVEGLSNIVTAADAAKAAASKTQAFLTAVRTNKAGDGIEASINEATKETKIDVTEPGYYLITETRGTTEEAFVMQVVDTDTTIKPKTNDSPVAEKHVHENTTGETTNKLMVAGETGYQDTADYAIGEEIPFILTADNIPTEEKLADWNNYRLTFTDTASTGLTLVSAEVHWATIDQNKQVTVGDAIATGEGEMAQVAVNDQTYTITVDIKKDGTYNGTGHDGQAVVVLLKGKLNDDAVLNVPGSFDEANSNKYTLTYTSNPEGETKTTPEDKTLIFTYGVDVTKVDGAKKDTKLTDAEFKLTNAEGKYYKVTDGTVSFVADATDATVLNTTKDGKFSVKGLDEGTYYLEETKTPAGYNSLNGLVKVVISSDKLTSDYADQAMTAVNDLTITTTLVNKESKLPLVTGDTGKTGKDITVENNKGTQLPSTGGMGTTMFYTVGGLMVAGAAVFMITSKRMKKED